MCRHLAYLGAPRSPAGPVFEAPHSLLVQSYAPADMRRGGTVNADGFGLAWFDARAEPVRYRRPSPLWTDEALPALAGSVASGAFLAAVRSGTPGMPVTEAACAPFTDGRWLFSHNGVVRGWPDSMAAMAKALPVTELLRLEAPTDSALVWAMLRARLRDGAEPARAVADLVLELEAAAPGSRLNFLLTDGSVLIGTTWTHALSLRQDADGVLLASEPLDDGPGWTPVPEHHLVVATAESADLIPLTEDRSG
ncbi:ergothioneine biosynthesis protein EgtC [Amycolatopsis sp. CA-230715]|uniref:ergothioneine biosynthesis protein EgtC n=1 Tax=Amycolatopsis sp. CA-230715 TaxID=2745196 RepID=UPI001C0227A3|nr:ergothioneine biosynthesis protein EgtC [Amycolatopsis sp. CA-230715]QWF85506.1 Gamma-glutamyl-hercynylcysteine sulfoxide hydrolase [Amycolatopsis sp. CA-230715]